MKRLTRGCIPCTRLCDIIRQSVFAFAGLVSVANAQIQTQVDKDLYAFTPADIAFLRNFSLSALASPPISASNQYADDLTAAKFGRALFFDKRLSKKAKFSCASCHQPQRFFTDGLARAQAFGRARRSTPTLLGVAWSPWQYWDGRKDSLWSQALAPIEDISEMRTTRSGFVRKLLRLYAEEYQAVFGRLDNLRELRRLPKSASPLGDKRARRRWHDLHPQMQMQVNHIFTNSGKALMAYQRKLRPPPARFDRFIDSLQAGHSKHAQRLLNVDEVKGLRLFMGKANCASCHNGPLLSNFEFHNVGVPEANPEQVDLGRYSGVASLVEDEFTCLSVWSDAKKGQCQEMEFLKRSGPELVGAFKTPSLRNIVQTAPYMHAGQFADLQRVLAHYNVPTPPFYDREQHPNRPHFDILPLKLSDEEIEQLIAFLDTLTSEGNGDDYWWRPPNVNKN